MSLVVCTGNGASEEEAAALAAKVNAPLSKEYGDDLTLLLDSRGLSLIGYGMEYQGDFERMLHRVTKGRFHHEMIARIAKTTNENPIAIDATAGMGEDSFILAASGYNVTLYEKNPVIAALLKDAMHRAEKNSDLKDIISRMHFIEGDSIPALKKNDADLIYLDPMFPARQKSGLIKKKLQLIQKLEQPCTDEVEMLNAALSSRPPKIIVKRPLKGECLAGVSPHYSINGKAIRYDCFVFPK